MDKVIDKLFMLIVMVAVFIPLNYIVFTGETDVSVKIVESFILIGSNIATFFFTKHQINKE